MILAMNSMKGLVVLCFMHYCPPACITNLLSNIENQVFAD